MSRIIRYSRIALLIIPVFLLSGVLIACGSSGTGNAEWYTIRSHHTGQYNLATVVSGEGLAGIDMVNDTHRLYQTVPEPDLIIESITWSPENPSKGDAVTISIIIKNQGSSQALTSRLDFYVDGNFKNDQGVQSIDAGGSVTSSFTWTAEQGSHTIKVIIDEENWIPENNENNNARSVTISTLAPDLFIQTVTWSPVEPAEGDNVTFTVTLKNQGNGKADNSLMIPYIDGRRHGSASVAAIDPGTTDNLTTFSWVAQGGLHTINLVVDPYNTILESDENNNEKIVDFPNLYPDLTIQSITWLPEIPSVTETVTFSVTIKNQGNAAASSSRLNFYIGGSTSGSQNFSGVAIAGSTTATFTWPARAGSHTVKAIIDPYNDINEHDETNNENEVTFSGALAPDLIVHSITWSPAEPSVGEEITFSLIIKNQGTSRADSSYVAYYIDDILLSSTNVSSMDTGDTHSKTFTWTVQEGSHAIKVVVDSNMIISESNEENNEKVAVYPVPPDLIIESITWSPENPSESDNVSFIVTVKNRGDSKADSSYIAYYVDDTYLAFAPIDPLDPGATDNNSFDWVGEAGSHTLRAIADPYDKVLENYENNNTRTVEFSVAPLNATTPLTPSPEAVSTEQKTVTDRTLPLYVPEKAGRTGLLYYFLFGVALVNITVIFVLQVKQRKTYDMS
ncbi:CARDB domain-containing protein [Chloroflexota bacterium]